MKIDNNALEVQLVTALNDSLVSSKNLAVLSRPCLRQTIQSDMSLLLVNVTFKQKIIEPQQVTHIVVVAAAAGNNSENYGIQFFIFVRLPI